MGSRKRQSGAPGNPDLERDLVAVGAQRDRRRFSACSGTSRRACARS